MLRNTVTETMEKGKFLSGRQFYAPGALAKGGQYKRSVKTEKKDLPAAHLLAFEDRARNRNRTRKRAGGRWPGLS